MVFLVLDGSGRRRDLETREASETKQAKTRERRQEFRHPRQEGGLGLIFENKPSDEVERPEGKTPAF